MREIRRTNSQTMAQRVKVRADEIRGRWRMTLPEAVSLLCHIRGMERKAR
jgi:hypothetical protein